MKLTIKRDALLKPLQLVAGVIERRQTIPILANVLLKLKGQELVLTGTDLEVELQARFAVESSNDGTITVPAKKLVDICRALPEGSDLELSYTDGKLVARSGRSRFSLITIPPDDFPNVKESKGEIEFSIAQRELRLLIERTQFAMAQQDIRYYLNGLFLEITKNALNAVATDGHRLAFCSISELVIEGEQRIIVPRKGIFELARLLTEETGYADVIIGANQLRIKTNDYTFTTKLIDGQYPDYHKTIPKNGDKVLLLDRDLLRQALNRVAVLSSEKHRAVRLELLPDMLRISANNPEQEEAEEELSVNYSGEKLSIGFNVNYLIDALDALPVGMLKLTLGDSNSSICIVAENSTDRVYVVSPMRL